MTGDATTTIYVCKTCKPEGFAGPDEDRPGAVFGRALLARSRTRDLAGRVAVRGVECLSVCKRPCTAAVAGTAKFAYVIGDLDAETHADDLLDFALLYDEAPDGITTWRARPEVVRKSTVARVPPFGHRLAPVLEIEDGE